MGQGSFSKTASAIRPMFFNEKQSISGFMLLVFSKVQKKGMFLNHSLGASCTCRTAT